MSRKKTQDTAPQESIPNSFHLNVHIGGREQLEIEMYNKRTLLSLQSFISRLDGNCNGLLTTIVHTATFL